MVTDIMIIATFYWGLYVYVPGSVLNVFHVTHFLSILGFMHTNRNIKYISGFCRSNNANISTLGSFRLGIRRAKFSPVFSLINCASKYITHHFWGLRKESTNAWLFWAQGLLYNVKQFYDSFVLHPDGSCMFHKGQQRKCNMMKSY